MITYLESDPQLYINKYSCGVDHHLLVIRTEGKLAFWIIFTHWVNSFCPTGDHSPYMKDHCSVVST